MTLEEALAALAETKEAVEKLSANNKKLTHELKQAKGQEVNQADYERLEAERDDLKIKLKEETKARAAAAKELESVSGMLKAESEAANRSFLDAQLTDALNKAGVVDADNLDLLRTKFAAQAIVTFDGKERKATIGDKAITDAIKEYPALAKFIPATPNGGGEVSGNKGGGSSSTENLTPSERLERGLVNTT